MRTEAFTSYVSCLSTLRKYRATNADERDPLAARIFDVLNEHWYGMTDAERCEASTLEWMAWPDLFNARTKTHESP